MNNVESSKGEIVMYQRDETIRLEGKSITCAKIAHVRFVYIFGANLKDAGKRLFAYIRMKETSATDILSGIR